MARQFLYLFAVTVLSWYAMMAVHEGGHCLGAWATGGVVDYVSIPLVGFSQTFYISNPNPLLTIWAGGALGALAGMLFGGLGLVVRGRSEQVLLYFAGFSLLANGIYLGVGGFFNAGDCGELLSHGAKLWQLVVFGLASAVAGFYFWHRLGPFATWFRGENSGPINV